jgi:hypothetical protein
MKKGGPKLNYKNLFLPLMAFNKPSMMIPQVPRKLEDF